MKAKLLIAAAVLLLVAALGLPVDLLAQETPTATPLEMRHFWHVFVAYALAWILLFGWVVSILNRFRRVEEKLN